MASLVADAVWTSMTNDCELFLLICTFRCLSYDGSIASSTASSQRSAILCFLLNWPSPRLPVTSAFPAICLSFNNVVLEGRSQLKCDGTRAETRFRLSAKRTSPFKSAGASVQSTTGSRGVCISGSNARYTMFWGSVKGVGYPLHSSVSPSLPLPCITVCHHISTGL